jgi:rsbT co-antagonist protein RsbR
MAPTDFEVRIQRLEEILGRVADGDLSTRVDVAGTEDALTSLEMGINFLIVDLRSAAQESRDKELQLLAQRAELEARVRTIEQQAAAIRDLSTPVIEVWDDILVLPVIGVVDSRRGAEIMDVVLERISAMQARCVVVDVTGAPIVDTQTADHLLRVVRAASLLGARCVLTGVSPAVAATVVSLGLDLGSIVTLRNLKAGLKYCLDHLEKTSGARRAGHDPHGVLKRSRVATAM